MGSYQETKAYTAYAEFIIWGCFPCSKLCFFCFPQLEYVMWDLANLNTNSILTKGRGDGVLQWQHTVALCWLLGGTCWPQGINAHHWSWSLCLFSVRQRQHCICFCLAVLSFPCQFWCQDAQRAEVFWLYSGDRQQMLFVWQWQSWSSSLWYLLWKYHFRLIKRRSWGSMCPWSKMTVALIKEEEIWGHRHTHTHTQVMWK